MKQYIHAVPNFSEGRNHNVIEAVIASFRERKGVKLLGFFPDADFNRTVIEAVGEPKPLKEALLLMTTKAVELINMEEQTGYHPRIGAQDTIPIFPLKNITLEECVALAEEIGKEIYERLGVPIYFSGANARTPERQSLDYIRKGQYEELKLVAYTPERAPDIGPPALHPTAGAIIVSASTRPLVAFNIILNTERIDIAKAIAKVIRGPSGGFSTVRAVGLRFEDRNQAVVSMNMFDYTATPLYRTYETVKMEAARYGVSIVGTEIVGTLPQEALIIVAEHYLQIENLHREQIIENHLLSLEDIDAD